MHTSWLNQCTFVNEKQILLLLNKIPEIGKLFEFISFLEKN